MKFAPIPCNGCLPGSPPFKIGEAAGSTPNIFIAGFLDFNN